MLDEEADQNIAFRKKAGDRLRGKAKGANGITRKNQEGAPVQEDREAEGP